MHPDRPRYDAVVVGARAAGAATAMLLADAGLTVLVLDRSRYGTDTLSTHALMRGGVLQLHRWGLLDRVIDAGTPPIRRTTFHYAHDDVAVTIKPAHGIDALYAPRRTVLDTVLVDAAVAAGAEVRYGVTVTDVRRGRGDRIVGIEGYDDTGRAIAVDAAVVIGADGLRSTIAKRVGAPVEHRGTVAGGVVYGYWSDVEADGYEWAYGAGAAAGLIPTNGGLTCVFAGSTPSRIGRGGHRILEDVVRQASPRIAELLTAGRPPAGVRTFAGQPGYLRRSFGPGWALVGDAGSWKDPISTHGLTDALRDAELLARTIVASADRDLGDGMALSTYQEARDRLTLPLLRAADAIATYAWSDSQIPALLLELSSSMAAEIEAIVDYGAAGVTA
ncbi:MAG TPA: FAD-dependent monooxygenase [Ilumatobacteraceae bacterium]|nr:FAD-dependent monooxygenase [Ilumatobacteraceae bacterium]